MTYEEFRQGVKNRFKHRVHFVQKGGFFFGFSHEIVFTADTKHRIITIKKGACELKRFAI